MLLFFQIAIASEELFNKQMPYSQQLPYAPFQASFPDILCFQFLIMLEPKLALKWN